MNKKSIIIIGCLGLVLSMMVGYALFSETININGTAKAGADFEITTTCTPGIMTGLNKTYIDLSNDYTGCSSYGGCTDKVYIEEKGYTEDTCKVVGNQINMSTKLKYPTAGRIFTVKFTNTGTVKAKIDTENTDLSQTDTIDGNLYFDGFMFYKNGVNQDALENPDYTLEPGESMYFVTEAIWASYRKIQGEYNYSVQYNVVIPFVQDTE